MPRRVEASSKRNFIKKGKDSSSTERCKCIEARRSLKSASKWLKIIKLRNTRRAKGPQKFIQSRDERPKKKKKPARLKTQKGGLGKS